MGFEPHITLAWHSFGPLQCKMVIKFLRDNYITFVLKIKNNTFMYNILKRQLKGKVIYNLINIFFCLLFCQMGSEVS